MSNYNKDQVPKLYKNKYGISFYSEDGEDFRYLFYNVKEILRFKNVPITKESVHQMNVQICKILRKGVENNICRFLTGEKLRLYLVDMSDDEDETELNEDIDKGD